MALRSYAAPEPGEGLMRIASKGEGPRRKPGLDGGGRRPRPSTGDWRNEATSAVDATALRRPVIQLGYGPRPKEGLGKTARRLDQALSQAKIRYAIDVPRGMNFLRVTVSATSADEARDLIVQLRDQDDPR
jgi:hypothetical protein